MLLSSTFWTKYRTQFTWFLALEIKQCRYAIVRKLNALVGQSRKPDKYLILYQLLNLSMKPNMASEPDTLMDPVVSR